MKFSENEFKSLLDRYLNHTASAEERAMLDEFFISYQVDFHDAQSLENNRELRDSILQEINSRINPVHPARYSRVKIWLPIAASISIFLLAYFFLGKNPDSGQGTPVPLVIEKTSPGQKLLTKLPDGTQVQLNGGSKISYPQNFTAETREVTLTGEAYFDVVKGSKPFIVYTNNIRTEVLGTSFNVKMSARQVEVTLVQGKVNIISEAGVSSTLGPNEQAIASFTASEIITKEVNTLPYISWKDNILYFEQTPLKEAVVTLEQWYGVNIKLENPALHNCIITAKYQHESLENVLSSFEFLLNLKVKRTDDTHLEINGNGCK